MEPGLENPKNVNYVTLYRVTSTYVIARAIGIISVNMPLDIKEENQPAVVRVEY